MTPARFFKILHHLERRPRLDLRGPHGPDHWVRVAAYGLELSAAEGTGHQDLVLLFALFHDAGRENDHHDPLHGHRGAEIAERYRRRGWFRASRATMRLLDYACRYHTAGWLDAPGAVQVCWDADRLDLWRVTIRPDPDRLCTRAARKIAHREDNSRLDPPDSAPPWVRDPRPVKAVLDRMDFWRATAKTILRIRA